jgi:uncharacterized protein (TIGR00369 family)
VPPAPRDPQFEARVRASFARQAFMGTCGARIASVAPGEVALDVDFRDDLTQQHGFLHAGVIAAVADSACGYAALSLMDAESAVMSVEFKVNLLAPAAGTSFRASARVVRAGRTLTVCAADVRPRGADGALGEPVAVMQATMMALRDRPGLTD